MGHGPETFMVYGIQTDHELNTHYYSGPGHELGTGIYYCVYLKSKTYTSINNIKFSNKHAFRKRYN